MDKLFLVKVFIFACFIFAASVEAKRKKAKQSESSGSGSGSSSSDSRSGSGKCFGPNSLLDECDDGRGRCWYKDSSRRPPLVCKPNCGLPPAEEHATLTTSPTLAQSFVGDSYTYVCDKGYAASPDSCMTIYCQPDGTWTKPCFECRGDCGRLNVSEFFDHGTVVRSSGHLDGDVAVVDCVGNHATSSSLYVYCDDGAWTPSPGGCQTTCGSPLQVSYPNAYQLPSTGPYFPGSVVLFNCSCGYSNPGCLYATCDVNGTWVLSDPDAECIADPPPGCSDEGCPSRECGEGEYCVDLNGDDGVTNNGMPGVQIQSPLALKTGATAGYDCSKEIVLRVTFDDLPDHDTLCLDQYEVPQRMLKVTVFLSDTEGTGQPRDVSDNWMYDFGDSVSNNGWAGDSGHSDMAAETQGLSGNIATYENVLDGSSCNAQLHSMYAGGANESVSCVTNYIANNYLKIKNDQGLDAESCSECLYGLNDQQDNRAGGTADKHVYIAANRVVLYNARKGHGVCYLKMKWVSSPDE